MRKGVKSFLTVHTLELYNPTNCVLEYVKRESPVSLLSITQLTLKTKNFWLTRAVQCLNNNAFQFGVHILSKCILLKLA
jgi:hypothetical protein